MTPDATSKLATLSQTACISVSGADATGFLHGQLSRRVVGAESERAPLAAWADARGRVRALARLVPAGPAWRLLLAADRAADVARDLSRYVLRSRVEIAVLDTFAAVAWLGDAPLERLGVTLPEAADACVEIAGIHWIRIGPGLVEAVGSEERMTQIASGYAAVDEAAAELAEIRLGIPSLGAGLEGRYLPQMLNLDLLDGISFDKGCYPGQEIIARTHHLGTLKRRMRRFAADLGAAPPPGTPVSAGDGETAGEVIRSAPSGTGAELLAVVRLERLSGALAIDDVPLRELPLPYG